MHTQKKSEWKILILLTLHKGKRSAVGSYRPVELIFVTK